MLHDLTYTENLQSGTQSNREWNGYDQGQRSGRKGEMLVKGYKLQLEDE